MRKRVILLLSSIFCISMLTYGVDAWIRINQLGYLPAAQKKAILISESPQQIKQFSIHDALTNELLATFNTVVSKGEFLSYKSTYSLDFSSFKTQGAFYIRAGLVYSPTIFINKNIYLGSADFSLNFIRQQRCGFNSETKDKCIEFQASETSADGTKTIELKPRIYESYAPKTIIKASKTLKKTDELLGLDPPKQLNIAGGWHNTSDLMQYGATSATAIYQLLFAYQMNPSAFKDMFSSNGTLGSNKIPDILDEAKWGLDWLLKMNPQQETIYHQIGEISDLKEIEISAENNAISTEKNRPVYLATGKPQSLHNNTNLSNGIASIAGKYSAAFGLGAEIMSTVLPAYADTLKIKAIETYQYGKKNPGVCQSIPGKQTTVLEEADWTDDMELAAAQLYRLTYDGTYLKEAADFGRMQPVTPWMCSDTARNYQWYPFINLGHYILANVENPRYQKEFGQDLLNGIHRMSQYASTNPFNIGVPFIANSNNLVSALATQCRLYRTITNDSTYLDMENNLTDWLFGRNPWGTSMVAGLPQIGDRPTNLNAPLWNKNKTALFGALINGPIQDDIFKKTKGVRLPKEDIYERFQSSWAVYNDNSTDYATNQPTLDGTAGLSFLLASKQREGVAEKTADYNQYTNGGITRTDSSKKLISLVFSGHDYADGYKTIRKTLKKLNIKASFFFSGDFYRKPQFKTIIKGLQSDNHYLGAHSDKHLLYCSWQKRDSLLVTKSQFLYDMRCNYAEMSKFNIHKNQTPFFLPPNEWYNDSISVWCKEIGVQLVNFTTGTLSNMDNSIPEMRENYFSSNEIYNKIIQTETKQGLNGTILLFHIGTDKRRQDKFYPRLYNILLELSRLGYDFVDLYTATDAVGKNEIEKDKKQKRKN